MILCSLLFTETVWLVFMGFPDNGCFKGKWSVVRVVIPRDLSHTGHFGALTKLLKFRFETKKKKYKIINFVHY